MEIVLHLLLIIISAIGLLFGLELRRYAKEQRRKPKDFRTYGKGVNKDDY